MDAEVGPEAWRLPVNGSENRFMLFGDNCSLEEQAQEEREAEAQFCGLQLYWPPRLVDETGWKNPAQSLSTM